MSADARSWEWPTSRLMLDEEGRSTIVAAKIPTRYAEQTMMTERLAWLSHREAMSCVVYR